jgi:hypothetical protein
VSLDLILAGPILRRVEPNLVAVWLALSQPATVKLALWENQIEFSDADETSLFFRGPDSGTKTIRAGEKLHIVVVNAKLPAGKTLVPERLYSYNVEIVVDGQTTTQNLKTLGLLSNDPANADADGDHTKNLALGYEPELLPCLLLPPKELKDLKLVHGSCRDTTNDFPDALAFADDLLTKDDAHKSAVARPHQLFLTGDQIYADDLSRPLLHMLNNTAQTLMGATEQIPFTDHSQPNGRDARAVDLVNFPVGRRLNLVLNEGGMTSSDGDSHLFSFGEFCAMYLFVWSNVAWGDQLDTLPKPEELPPADFDIKITSPVLKDLITKNDAGETVEFEPYTAEKFKIDVARLTEFHRTLPKVRRALANIPTYMIFDDHEISDDWFLNPTWRDRVLGSPLGNAIIRNGLMAYALFQGWGNDPVKFTPQPGEVEKQKPELLLEQTLKFLPAGAASGPDPDAAGQIEKLLGLDLRNQIAFDGSYAETNPPLKWHYTVPGQQHGILVLDCRTRRAYASRVSPPGNIGLTAQTEQIPEKPDPADKKVWIVISSLPVLGPPIFDELLAPLLFRAFDFKDRDKLQRNRGTKRMPGTNPDAVEAWCFDPKLFEALIKRLQAYSPVILLSGDVHYSASNAMTYWTKTKRSRFVQFVSSGLKNVMPGIIVFVDRSFAIAQKMSRSRIGAERMGWEKNSPDPLTIAAGANVSPRFRSLLRKSPVLIPTIGWPEGTKSSEPDWAWRVCPIRDIRAEVDRPKMGQPVSLFPEDPSKKENDVAKTDLEGYHRVAERHSRELERLNNCRQILFASSLAVIRFENREDPDKHVNVTYAIQDMYAIQPDPEQLVGRPKPEIYTSHEVPLDDLWQAQPQIPPAEVKA